MTDQWLILRTSSRNTLKLAQQLTRDGFDAWTPARTFRKRAPRNLGIYEVTAPMLPTFAFARASHVHALLALADDPVKPCPDFSVFHYNDRIPLVRDGELSSLRRLEEKSLKRAEAERLAERQRQIIFQPGQEIKVEFGPFSGMTGIVKKDDGKFTAIDFGLGKPVKISTFKLNGENILCPSQSVVAKAA